MPAKPSAAGGRLAAPSVYLAAEPGRVGQTLPPLRLAFLMTGVQTEVWIGIGRSGCPSPLPPNRTGGFPASGFPVGGFASERIDRSEPERCGETARAQPGQRELPGIPQGDRQYGQ